MSSLSDTRQSFSQIRDAVTAKAAWRSWASWDARAPFALATCSVAPIRELLVALESSARQLSSAASAYYEGGDTHTETIYASAQPLLTSLEDWRTRLEALYGTEVSYTAPATTATRVTQTRIPCPLPRTGYTLLGTGVQARVDPELARLETPLSSTGRVTGIYLWVGNDGMTYASYFDTEDEATMSRLTNEGDAIVATLTDEGDAIVATESRVVCIRPYARYGARARGCLGRGQRRGARFMFADELARLIGGQVVNESFTQEISVTLGAVEGLRDYDTVHINESVYVVLGGQLVAHDASLPGPLVFGIYNARVVRQAVICPTEVRVSPAVGEVMTYEGGEPLQPSGDAEDGEPSTRVELRAVLRAWPSVSITPFTRVATPHDAEVVATDATTLMSAASTLRDLLPRLMAPLQQRTLIFTLLDRLERRGLDQAADMLRQCRLQAFLDMPSYKASYKEEIKAISGSLIVRAQS
jgi:hypothetical protein